MVLIHVLFYELCKNTIFLAKNHKVLDENRNFTRNYLKETRNVKILTNTQMKEWDRFTIEHEPISSADLMERAARALTAAVAKRWGPSTQVFLFAGPGNNGGDTLAMARMLCEMGYRTHAFLFNTSGRISDDCLLNKQRLQECAGASFTEVTTQFTPPTLTKEDLVVDGLFGSGLNKPLSGGFASVVKYLNSSPATVVAVDIPSGMMGESNDLNIKTNIVRADLTLTLQQPKLAFLFAENQETLGELEVLDIQLHPQGTERVDASYFITEREEMQRLVQPRKRFAHKGNFGHALLIAGKYGMAGASILAARSCLKSGVGLLTVHAPQCNNQILQISVPEAIVDADENEFCFSSISDGDLYDAIAIGPGIGQHPDTALAVIDQAKRSHVPVILDADALNILSTHKGWLTQLPKGTILTPHPKELERIVGFCNSSYERLNKAKELAMRQQIFVVVKGAWTAVVTPDGKFYFNPTGNPGMATAGSGDVLTGVLLALVAQGYTSEDACRLGVYVHGLAGDLAAEELGEISMTAQDLVEALPRAWKQMSRPQE
jgi:NAD(P)H-hydrate epimerase